jgi:hypothetical protein
VKNARKTARFHGGFARSPAGNGSVLFAFSKFKRERKENTENAKIKPVHERQDREDQIDQFLGVTFARVAFSRSFPLAQELPKLACILSPLLLTLRPPLADKTRLSQTASSSSPSVNPRPLWQSDPAGSHFPRVPGLKGWEYSNLPGVKSTF